VTHQLLERGESVRVLVREPRKLADVALEAAAGAGTLEVAAGDLLEPASLEAALRDVSAVLHIAGFISTRRADRAAVHRLNHDATVNLFAAARAAGVERVVYLASIFALGAGRGQEPVTEEVQYDLGELAVDYFAAKRRAELHAHDCVRDGLPVVFVYPGFCYGPGDVYGSSSQLLLAHLQRLPVYFPGGQNAMDVRDAAAGLIRGLDRGRVGEKYLIGGENRSYAELGRILAEITGYRPPRFRVPGGLGVALGRLAEAALPGSPLDAQAALIASRFWYYDDSKARRELGHRSRPLRETFTDAIRWLCARGMARWPPRLRA
jgi:dihydroflavonol-4-reductase